MDILWILLWGVPMMIVIYNLGFVLGKKGYGRPLKEEEKRPKLAEIRWMRIVHQRISPM